MRSVTEREAMTLKRRYSRKLMERPEVCGVGVTEADDGEGYVLAVLLSADATPQLRDQVEADLDGHPFKFIVTGPFRLLLA